MSNNKQSSVDLMFNRAISVLPMGAIDARQRLKETYEQAKEMEKQQQDLLNECEIQLEYLNQKFGETGTTNALLAKLKNK